jgi:outer membrane protein TolC
MKIFILTILVSLTASNIIASELSLEEFLKKVQVQNLNLKLEAAKQNLAEEKSVGLRLPPPMLGITKGKEEQGNSPNGLEINQEVPFPAKLKADHNARIIESKAQQEMLKANQNEILSKAKLSYIDLWIAQEKIGVINQKRRVLEDHIKLSRSAVRSDSFLKIHLLKAESDLDLLENELESAKQILKEKKYVLADIVNEAPQSFDIEAVEPPISSVPQLTDSETTPQIASMKLTLDSLKAREDEAKASWLPDFNLRYKEMGATSMSNKYREVMVGITLPFVYFWEPKVATTMANIEKMQAEINLNKEKRTIDIKFATLSSKVESLKKQLSNLKNKLLPRAEQRMKLVHNLAPRDMETIQDHRETMEAFPNLKMAELELRMQYEETIAELEKYIVNKGSSHE